MTYGEQVGSLRRTLHRALVRHLAERTRRPLPQLLALRTISRREVETQVELAERLLIDAPAASRLVALLEKQKLLKRNVGEDRRCVCLEVLPAAKPEIKVIDEGLAWLESQVERHLTKHELETSKVVLAKLQRLMSAPHGTPSLRPVPNHPERRGRPRRTARLLP
jgi:DNA-binding MarR family transcriptional regulator